MSKSGWFIGLVLVAGVGVFFYQSVLAPTGQTGHSMSQPDLSGIQDGAPIAEVTLPETLSANAQIGKRAFEAKCADCHGANAAGQKGVAPPLVHIIYEPSHHSDAAFILAAKNGVRAHHWNFGNMPAVEGITDAEVKLIAAYVRELQRANGIN